MLLLQRRGAGSGRFGGDPVSLYQTGAMAFGRAAVMVKKNCLSRDDDVSIPAPRLKAVILLVNTIHNIKYLHKCTKDHCGTVPIGWCLLYFCCFRVVLLAWDAQNAQIAQINAQINSCSGLIDLLNKI
jgi:hypothetical protein